jgi:hypothetical protein
MMINSYRVKVARCWHANTSYALEFLVSEFPFGGCWAEEQADLERPGMRKSGLK